MAATVELVESPTPMRLLEGGIPLSLLLDLVLGPHSEDLLRAEPSPHRIPPQPGA